jgi:SAM-dependent methyltransferase
VKHRAEQASNDSARVIGDERLWELREHYASGFPLAPLSYGTARDLADSTDHMPGLAGASFDMKGLQRCWMAKAVLGNVEPGSRILEIGAGEPLVAGLLARMGYRVTVVDPYDGSGNGPREYARFRRGYPDVDFRRERFPPRERLEGNFGAVYSISVLEHVPADALEGLIGAAHRLLAPGRGCSIHAIDHVVAGWGDEEHRQKLERIAAASDCPPKLLDETLELLERDPEAYFVSAEAHNRWRGALDYDLYPMRRIVSIQLFKRV